MHSKKFRRRVLPITMAAIMVASCFPAMAANNDPWSFDNADRTTITITLDKGTDAEKVIDVTRYTDEYLDETGYLSDAEYANALVNVWIPDTATEDSPILYLVNNSGWMSNTYKNTMLTDGGEYTTGSEGQSTFAAMAAAEGYIVVDAGLRSRSTSYNHSPVTVADAKAVIRYLRHNNIGNTDRIFISGTSGGGALSVAIAADGNSADFYDELYSMGAAGMTNATTSTINDDIFGTVAYCPITDLGHADGSYEFTYAGARQALIDAGLPTTNKASLNDYTMLISDDLAAEWAEYVTDLEITYDGKAVTAGFDTSTLTSYGTLYDTMVDLLEDCLQKAYDDLGESAFIAKLNSRTNKAYNESELEEGWQTSWLSITDGKVEIADVEEFMMYVAMGEELKNAPAFTNQGTENEGRNENNLFGKEDDLFAFNSEIVWNIKKDTSFAEYDSWDEYWADYEELVTKQMRMLDSIAYLTDENDGDSAPYWYVRHGIVDRDTSFANQTLLYLAMESDDTIEDVNFQFEWYRKHEGSYGLEEALAFMDASIAAADAKDAAQQPTTPPATDDTTTPPAADDTTTPPATDDTATTPTTGSTSPKTGDVNTLPLFAVVIAVGAVALASTRKRAIH